MLGATRWQAWKEVTLPRLRPAIASASAIVAFANASRSVAFAIAVTFRVVSAYLHPVWGWFSMRWLEHNDYLCAAC